MDINTALRELKHLLNTSQGDKNILVYSFHYISGLSSIGLNNESYLEIQKLINN